MKNLEKRIWISQTHTIGQWINESIKNHSKKTAIVDGRTHITYTDLGIQVNHYSSYFLQKGIRKGNKVVIQLNNTKEYVFSILALIQIGAIPVLTNYALRDKEVTGIIERSEAIAYVYSKEILGYSYKSMAERIKKRNRELLFIISVAEIEMSSFSDKNIILETPEVKDIAILMLSGGTTGTPKIVPLSHEMIYWHIKCYIDKFGFDEDSVYLGILPFTHKFALYSPGLLNSLFVGGTVVMCKTSSYDEIFPLIEREKVTITGIVPSLARMWLEVLSWDNSFNLSSLKRIIIGGALVEKRLIKEMVKQFPCDIHIGYGATEGIIMYNAFNRSSLRINNGYKYLISGYENIKIVDSEENTVENGQSGEIVIKGPYTINKYFNVDDNTMDKFTYDGFYRTGDKAIFNEYGEYEIIGRIVDQINRAGEKINPQEIENYLCECAGVKEAVVVGVKDELLGERICAFVIPDKMKQITDGAELKKNLEVKESNSLTDVQYAYWIGRGEKQILGGVSCHAYFEFKGLGLDTDKLKEAWYKIQQRHPMLRARFLENGTQQIIEQNKFSNELIIYDLREKQSEIEEHLLKIRTTNSHRVFDIEKGHVAALEVTIINNKEYVIHFDIDLLVADLKSIGIVLNDLAALYGDKYLPELPNNINFMNRVVNTNQSDYVKDREYWNQKMDDIPGMPELPICKKIIQIKKPVFKRRNFFLDENKWKYLLEICAFRQVTPAMVLLSLYAEVLGKFSNSSRFLINVPLFGRPLDEENIDFVVGDFTNILLLPIDISGKNQFIDQVNNITDIFMEAMKHIVVNWWII